MGKAKILAQINADLTKLCVRIDNRHVGSQGNRDAGQYVAKRMTAAGLIVTQPEFDCIDWEHGDITLKVASQPVAAFISPYSPSCEISGPFATAANIAELEVRDFAGKIAVFHGDLCQEQIVPRNYVFYNRAEHQKILQLIDAKQPPAIIAITSHNPETTGGEYPFPLFEDGDFNIPSAYLNEEEGAKLLSRQEAFLELKMASRRIPATGFNIIGTKPGCASRKIVFCAHIDTKKNTPGALDNATGVVTLLTLADLLQDYRGKYHIELLAVNGEDYYAAPGQMDYIAKHQGCFDQIVLAVNTDGAGYINGRTGYCCLFEEETLSQMVAATFGEQQKFIATAPWYQSDHSWFTMHGVPAVAVTSEAMTTTVMTEITHTPKDNLAQVDPYKIAELACALKKLIDLVDQEA
jgi:aminopeptidase YwaD